VSCLQCAAKPRSASPLFQYERQGAARLPDCPQLCMQKSHRDRQVRRVHIRASCPPIAREHLLNLFVGRQIAPSRACFDDLPFLFADVVENTTRFSLSWCPIVGAFFGEYSGSDRGILFSDRLAPPRKRPWLVYVLCSYSCFLRTTLYGPLWSMMDMRVFRSEAGMTKLGSAANLIS
jgi:hypothetical protein